MRSLILAVLVAATLAGSLPASAGGYDHLWFEERYYRAGEVVRAEVGVSTPSPMRATFQLTRTDGRVIPSAVVRADVESKPLTDQVYVDPEGGSMQAEYRAEVEFRLPALPPGEYWVELYCGLPCRPRGPWPGGTFVVVGPMPVHGPARPGSMALAS